MTSCLVHSCVVYFSASHVFVETTVWNDIDFKHLFWVTGARKQLWWIVAFVENSANMCSLKNSGFLKNHFNVTCMYITKEKEYIIDCVVYYSEMELPFPLGFSTFESAAVLGWIKISLIKLQSLFWSMEMSLCVLLAQNSTPKNIVGINTALRVIDIG